MRCATGHLLPTASPVKSCYSTKIKIIESNELNERGSHVQRMKGDRWRLLMMSLRMRGKQRDVKDRKFDTKGPATDAAPVALKQCQACSACYLSLYHPDISTRKSINTNSGYSTQRQRPKYL